MSNNQKVIELFDDLQNNLIFLAVTKKGNDEIIIQENDFQEKLDNKYFNYKSNTNKNYYMHFTGIEHMKFFITEISKICYSFQNKIIFVIFCEYFFGKNILNKDGLEILCDEFQRLAKEIPNVHIFFFLNIFIEEIDVNIDEMTIYADKFTIDDFYFCPSDKDLKYNNKKEFYSNSTFIIYKGKPIIKYMKSSYANEKLTDNYILGFGNMILLINDDISRKIADLVDVFICMDITVRPFLEMIYNVDFSFSQDEAQVNKIDKLKELLTKHNNKFVQKKIIIVQSNTIELTANLFNFAENSIVIQVDPQTTFAFQVCYNEFFKKGFLFYKERYKKLKDYITNKYYQNVKEQKRELFLNEFNYFNYKRAACSLNSIGISKKIDSILNFSKNDKMFECQYNAFTLKNLKI